MSPSYHTLPRAYIVQFTFPHDRTEKPHYVRKRADRFGSWYTAKREDAKIWKRESGAQAWIASRSDTGFKVMYAAQVIDMTFQQVGA